MVKIDLKDRKILYQLDIDSRQPLSTIGKKVGLPKTVVAYRIKKLEKQGVIKNYYTVIDPLKLGYHPIRFYLAFQFTTASVKNNIIDFFKNNKYTWWVASLDGEYDLAVNLLVKQINDFSKLWDKALKKYLYHFSKQLFSIYFQLLSFEYSYLSDNISIANRKKYEITYNDKAIEIDDIDFKILRLIASDARMKLKEISKKLNITPGGIRYRIKKLEKLNIIKGYRINIDLEKIGYKDFKLDLFLKDYNQRSIIIDYIKNNHNLVLISKSAGISELELEFHVQDSNQLFSIIEDLENKFPDVIKNHRYFYIQKQHKWKHMPDE